MPARPRLALRNRRAKAEESRRSALFRQRSPLPAAVRPVSAQAVRLPHRALERRRTPNGRCSADWFYSAAALFLRGHFLFNKIFYVYALCTIYLVVHIQSLSCCI